MSDIVSGSLDLSALRADTPSCIATVHLDHAAASPTPEPVHRAMIAHLDLERRIGGQAAAERSAEELDTLYSELAALIGAPAGEIAFAETTAGAWRTVLDALPLADGDRMLMSQVGSDSQRIVDQARRRGLEVDMVPNTPEGLADTAALEAMIGPQTRLIWMDHAPADAGVLNPAEDVGRIARRYDLIYVVDASQSVGQIALDVEQIGCDILVGAGQRFLRAPQGTAFLFFRSAFLERQKAPNLCLPQIDGLFLQGRDSRSRLSFESCGHSAAARIALGRAARYARAIGLSRIEARVTALAATLRTTLAEVPGVTVHDKGRRHTGIITFTKAGERAAATRLRLQTRGIALSVILPRQTPKNSPMHAPEELVRASVHYFNTEAELMRLVDAVKRSG